MTNGRIISEIKANGADVSGFADLVKLAQAYPDFWDNFPLRLPFAVSIGIALSRGVLDTMEDRPNPLYFSHYRQVNYALDRIALRAASLIQEEGFKAIPIPASQVISRNPMTAQICHRRVAWQAGQGSRGLNNLLVNPEYGSALRLVSVLTDMPLDCGNPTDDACDLCGKCRKVCPAGAIGKEFDDFQLDRCAAKLDEFSKIPFVSQHICGVCISACRGKRK